MTGPLAPTRRDFLLGSLLALGGGIALPGAGAQIHPKSGDDAMATPSVIASRDLSLAGARALLDKGLALAHERGLRLSIAAVDRSGHQLAFVRMDGAAIVTVDVAIGKARTAAFLKAPSKLFEDMINSGKPSMASTPGLTPLQGGVPVLFEGEIVGAIGVSGSSGEGDQEMAALIAGSFGAL